MAMTTKVQADISRKLKVLNNAKEFGNIFKACQFFEISNEAY